VVIVVLIGISCANAQNHQGSSDDLSLDMGTLLGLESDESEAEVEQQTRLRSLLIEPSRVTLSHEIGYKVAEPTGLQKNRSAVRLEYAKNFFDNYFVQLDVKSTVFHGSDHRRNVETSFERVNQAYLQTSFDNFSFKFGLQTIVWGESILSPVTDEVNPRDNRELFNFNLDELRLAQPMVSVDNFSDFGRWSAFLNLSPSFNDVPRLGSDYFFDPFDGEFSLNTPGKSNSKEYGGSWKNTFGNLDLSLVFARLIDNDRALSFDSPGVLNQTSHRYSLTGFTFSYVIDSLIFKGELGYKSQLAFNNSEFELIERDVVDSYFGFEYQASSTLTLSLDLVNRTIVDGSDNLLGVQQNQKSIMLNVNKLLLRDNLSLNFIGIYNHPKRSHLGLLQTEYDINDNLTAQVAFAYPHSDDPGSALALVSDQKQLTVKISYQF
jgi:hypothetical protein